MIENKFIWKIPILKDILGVASRIVRSYDFRFSVKSTTISKDIGNVSYEYWDKAYHGRQEGLEISGLLIKPLVNKVTAWTFGKPFKVKFQDARKTRRFMKWLEINYHVIFSSSRTSVKLGDGYLVVNPDLSVVSISPSSVFPIMDEQDLSKHIGWVIVQEFPNPQNIHEKHLIRDEYTYRNGKYTRRRVLQREGRPDKIENFSLPLSRVPIIHIPNNPSENERFGRPEAEAMVQLFHRYGAGLDAALDGNEKQGRPTPTFSKLGSDREVRAFWERHGTVETTEPDENGRVETYHVLDFDADRAVTLGGDAEFHWESPGSASNDTKTLLGILWYIYIQHTEVPEWVYGSAISGSKASAEVQVDPLVYFIGMKRLFAEPWLRELILTVSEMMSLSEPYMKLEQDELVELVWPVLTRKDGQLILQAVQWAYGQRIITKHVSLDHLPFDVIDTDRVIEDAGKEVRPELEERSARQKINQQMNEDDSIEFRGDGPEDQSNNASGNKNGPDRSTEE